MGDLKVFTTQGRLNRKPYNIFSFVLMMIPVVIITLMFLLQAYLKAHLDFVNGTFANALVVSALIAVFIVILCFIGQVTLTIRRLHDLNLSGWFYLLFIIPDTLTAALYNESNFIMKIISIVLTLIPVIFFLLLMFKRGTVSENKYGADPLSK